MAGRRMDWNAPGIRCLLAFLSGLLLTFPLPTTPWLVWVAPGLILGCAKDLPGGRRFLVGFCAGIGMASVTFSWLLQMPVGWYALMAWIGMCLYLALYPAFWLWMAWKLRRRNPLGLPDYLWPLQAAIVWIALEMILARFLYGVPYAMGISQAKVPIWLQVTSVAGLPGLSFIIVWFSVSLTDVAFRSLSDRKSAGLARPLHGPMILVAIAWGFGLWRIGEQGDKAETRVRIALIQPSVPQSVIWDPAERTNRFLKLVKLSEEAMQRKPDLVVWPEASMPQIFTRFNKLTHDSVTNLVGKYQAPLLFGVNDTVRKSTNSQEMLLYNAAFLIEPDGRRANSYRKQHLVPFGEYMPLAEQFPWLNRFRKLDQGVTPGDKPVFFRLNRAGVNFSVLICAEDQFARWVRPHAGTEADLLINLTNDGWFIQSGQWLHALSGLIRAAEFGLPLVRCSNNGITGWIDRKGTIRQVFRDSHGSEYGEGYLIADIPVKLKHSPTLYQRWGDWFGWGCVGISIVMLSALLFLPRNQRGRPRGGKASRQ